MEFELIYKICIVISCLFEIYLVMDFYSAFHEYRTLFFGPFQRFLAFVILVCINVGINFQNNSFGNLIFVPILYFSIVIIMFRGNPQNYFLHWIVATFVMFSSEFVFLMLQGIPMDVPTDRLFQEPFTMLSSIFAVKLVTFILFLVLKQVSKYSTKRFAVKMFGYYIIVPVATLGIIWAIPYVRQINEAITVADVVLVLFYALMLIGNIVLFYVFVQYNYIKEQELQREVALAKYKEKEWYYNEIQQIEKQHRVLIHNIKHYLKQIGTYAKKGDNTEIIHMIKELQIEFLESENKVICAHSLLNSILLEWQDRAKKQGVKTEVFVEAGFNINFMRGTDIMALFGNLLDNAGEAACKCEVGEVQVKLFMQNDGAFSVICIENNHTGNIMQRNGELLSTKREGGYHGIGLKNAKEIVERYRGSMQNRYSEQLYEIVIMIPAH